jgi:putative serine protease PepD
VGGDDTSEPAQTRGRRPGSGRLLLAVSVAALTGGVVGGLLVNATSGDGTEPRSGSSANSGSTSAVCQASSVAANGLPSVVTIAAGSGQASGTGSGAIIADGGYILTNDHVISVAADGGKLTVRYSDGRSSPARIVGRDPLTDLAVIQAADASAGLPVIPLGSSQSLVVGQPVVALGAPLGLSSTVTTGIVSALDRHVPVPSDGKTAHLVGAIQTDAAINPGNSGGALVNCAGQLVGVNTAIATVPNSAGQAGGGSVGLGFAIPVDLAQPISDELIATGTVTHFTLGMQVQRMMPDTVSAAGLPQGLFVLSVSPGGPAEQAGIVSGDVVTQINGQPALSAEQVTVAEISAKAGADVEITFERGGSSYTVTVRPERQT